MLSLCLSKGMFWISEQRLCDQANAMCRSRWMAELDLEEPERNLSENNTYQKEEKSADNTDSNLGEEMRDILTAFAEVLQRT